MNLPTTAIIDGDIVAYRAAFWADTEGIEELPGRIMVDIQKWTPPSCTTVYVAMSCPRDRNYRRAFWPDYKKHRDDFKSPDSLRYAIECIYDTQDITTRCVNRLEADDLLGIMVSQGMSVGVTVDKDLRQIPGWHWNPDKEPEPVHISQEEADLKFYTQWIMGDSTDNVWGLWKVGPKKAAKILEETPKEEWDQVIMGMYEAEDWLKRPVEKTPLVSKEEFALAQARCIRILRDGDYDKDNCKIKLWSPNNLVDRNILDLSTGELINE